MRARPADPKQCRENALLCTELAEKVDALARANLFRNLAKRNSFQNNCEMSPIGT
jgi:hypothetical protein